MEEMRFTVIDPGINVQYVPAHDDLRKCVELGRKVGKALKEGV
jgi:flavorubredoxin